MAQTIIHYTFYISLGLLPSLIWLSFYLRKDKHPEPNSMVLKIFFYGMLLAPLAIFFELLLVWLINPTSNPLALLSQMPQNGIIRVILAATLIPALVEEYLKYGVIKLKVLKNAAFDEPIDTMIYFIIVGLGFAAIENLLILFRLPFGDLSQAIGTIAFRFLGATLVHALASAMVGYWLALGLLYSKKRKRYTFIGLSLAIIFHSCYNYLVVTTFNQTNGNQKLLFFSAIIVLMIATALTVSMFLKKLKKQQAICKITKF